MNERLDTAAILPGLQDPVLDAQRIFRSVLAAISRPGTVQELESVPTPVPLNPASMAVCLALLDYDTPLWLDPAARAGQGVREHLRFHCGCPLVEQPARAAFALVTDSSALPELEAFARGSDEYPERSTTLIVQVNGLESGGGWRLRGPGIPATARLGVQGLAESFPAQWRTNHAIHPRGVDLLLTCGNRIAALPRSVELEA